MNIRLLGWESVVDFDYYGVIREIVERNAVEEVVL